MQTYERLSSYTRDEFTQSRALDCARYLSCLAERPAAAAASARYLERWPRSVSAEIVTKALDAWSTKAAVLPGTTTGTTWAEPLVPTPLVDALLGLARSASLLGRIPGLRKVPFKARTPIVSQGASFAWVGEGSLKPVSKYSFGTGITLGPSKAQGIIVITEELAKLTIPGTEQALLDEFVGGLTDFTDRSFLDPAAVAVPGVQPGSVTAGLTPTTSTGNLATDVASMAKAFYAARPGAAGAAVLIMGGAEQFALLGPHPGATTYGGLPVIATGAADGLVVILDPRAVCVADNGVALDVSRHAALVLDDAPTSGASAVVTSLWPLNLVGYQVERFVNWEAAPGAVAYLEVA